MSTGLMSEKGFWTVNLATGEWEVINFSDPNNFVFIIDSFMSKFPIEECEISFVVSEDLRICEIRLGKRLFVGYGNTVQDSLVDALLHFIDGKSVE